MRAEMLAVVEAGRVTTGPLRSTAAFGRNGAFRLRNSRRPLLVIASDGGGWEHVSVSLANPARPDETPTWEEMQWVKVLFWEDEETVVQFHPPASRYVNRHPGCLHLWRPAAGPELPLPPRQMVG